MQQSQRELASEAADLTMLPRRAGSVITKVRSDLLKKQIEKNKGKIMSNEQDEDIIKTSKTYANFFGPYYGGWWFFIKAQIVMILFSACKMGGDYLIGNWSQSTDQSG